MQDIKKHKQKIAAALIFVLLFLWFSLFLMKKIDLTTADLGRHIKNGEIILSSGLQNFSNLEIFKKNYYSYTNPDFPFINHHWGSGVVFYLIFRAGGWFTLSFFYILLSILTFGIFFFMARKEAGTVLAVALSMILIPLMASRSEIRPEIFTYLFSGIFFFICYFSQKSAINPKWLYLLIPLSFVWANLHIAFFFGFIIMGIFLAEGLLSLLLSHSSKWKKILPKRRIKELAVSFILSLFVTVLNPNGLAGVLEILKIFKNYGYLIVENQSIGFLEKLNHTAGLNFLLFKISFLILLVSFIFVLIRKRKSFS
ncbi:MAG: hypothetical protein Q8O66_02245, partial [bacterium]|nr:hypothetical protein [bacterium]